MSTDDDAARDERMDRRLAAAGQQWRERNTEPARVDLAAQVAAPAEAAGPTDLTGPAGDGTAARPLPLVPEAAPAHGRRRTRLWLASAAGLAAAVVAVVLAVQLGGSSGPHHPAAGGGTPLVGTQWQLSAMADAHGTALPVVKPVQLSFDARGVQFADGCNSGGGDANASGSTITFGRLMTTMMACLDRPAGLNAQTQLIHAVISGAVGYAIDGDTLTLTKTGVGTLTYTAGRPTTSPAVTDPSAILGTWRLTTVEPGNNIARSFGSASSAPPASLLTVSGDRIAGSVGCWAVTAPATIGAGTLSVGKVGLHGSPGCGDSQDFAIVLGGAATWQVNGTQLTISDTHGGALLLERAATVSAAPTS